MRGDIFASQGGIFIDREFLSFSQNDEECCLVVFNDTSVSFWNYLMILVKD